MALTPPKIVDNAYIQIRDMRNNNNGYTAGGQFSFASADYFFPAFVTGFSDEFVTNHEQTSVYGRMDPINVFQNTQRSISLSFMCPSKNEKEAEYYLSTISALIRSMYPNYSAASSQDLNSSIITAPPIFAIQFGNLIQDPNGGLLVGVLPSLTFSPKLDEGMFIQVGKKASSGHTPTVYLPKSIEVNLTFNPLHTFNLGFNDEKEQRSGFSKFPYEDASGPRAKGYTNAKDYTDPYNANENADIKFIMENSSSPDEAQDEILLAQLSDILG